MHDDGQVRPQAGNLLGKVIGACGFRLQNSEALVEGFHLDRRRLKLPAPPRRTIRLVTTPTMSWPSSASSRRDGIANSGVPQKRIFTPSLPPAGSSSTS